MADLPRHVHERLLIGEFEIEPATRRLRRRDGELIHLANRPFQVLLHLVANRDRLVSRAELLEQFWDGRDVYEDALTRCMSTVRKALDDQGSPARYIETRWAEGYRFVGPCHAIESPPPLARSRRQGASRSGVDAGTPTFRRRPQVAGRHCCGAATRTWAVPAIAAIAMHSRCSGRRSRSIRKTRERTAGSRPAMHSLYLHAEPTDAHRIAAAIGRARTRSNWESTVSRSAARARARSAMMRADHVEADTAFAQAESLEPWPVSRLVLPRPRVARSGVTTRRAAELYRRASAADPFDYQALALAEQSFRRIGAAVTRRIAPRRHASDAGGARAHAGIQTTSVRLSLGGCVLPNLDREGRSRGWTERAVALEPDEPFVNFNAACVLRSHSASTIAHSHFLERVPLSAQGNCNWIAHDPCTRSGPGRMPRFHAMMQLAAS